MAEITIPFRSEDDLAIEVVDAARETLDGDQLRVMEQIALRRDEQGHNRVAGLLAELEGAGARKTGSIHNPVWVESHPTRVGW